MFAQLEAEELGGAGNQAQNVNAAMKQLKGMVEQKTIEKINDFSLYLQLKKLRVLFRKGPQNKKATHVFNELKKYLHPNKHQDGGDDHNDDKDDDKKKDEKKKK